MIGRRTSKHYIVTSQQISNFALITYFCMPFIRFLFSKVGLSFISYPASFVITYFPLVLLIAVQPSSRKKLIEFLVLVIYLVAFLGITIAIHPDYAYWYTRETYGILPYIFRPDNGIYAFLLIRLVDDAEQILKDLYISGWIMYVFFFRQLMNALARGYWTIEAYNGADVQSSYSLDFGYNVMFFALVFLYLALRYKRLRDVFACAVGIAMCLIGGSRGSIVCIGAFLVIYLFISLQQSRMKFLYITIIALLTLIMFYFYEPILLLSARTLERFGLPSRFIHKMINGSIFDGTGRNRIWDAAIQMIKEKPLLGHGAMGARPVISRLHIVGYPHQFFLEMFIEYGVIIGGAISLFLIISSIRILCMKNIGEWKFVFLVFFANALELMLSYTYWHKHALWSTLAVGMCIMNYRKRYHIT